MTYATALRCRKCEQEYPLQASSRCDFCLSPLDAIYDYKAISKILNRQKITQGPRSIWRYQDLLPIDGKEVDIGAGFTPMIKADRLGSKLGLNKLYIKNDCLNPTYSFKDRAVAVATTKAVELGFDTIACASTGNLAASVAAHAAKANLKAYVFVPASVETGKLVGIAIHNPVMMAVQGNYDDINRLCAEVAQKYNWGFININLRPYYAEGSKTMGYEIAEQLGWRTPDCVVAPAASGLLFTRIWKAFEELSIVGLIKPGNARMYVSQAAGSAPIVKAFASDSLHVNPVKPDTIAGSIAIGNPADGYHALKVARLSGGGACAVTDAEIIEGVKLLAQTEGIFAEPVGGVVIGVLKKLAAAGTIKRDEVTVACITGAGPRTQEIVGDIVSPFTIQSTLQAVDKVLDKSA